MRRLLALAVVIAVSAGGAVAAAGGPRHPRLAEARILAVALRAAGAAGDAQPSLVEHAAGTRARANAVGGAGEGVSGRAWSLLVLLRGRFVLAGATRPRGAPAPRGSVLTLVLDARTGAVTDEGLGQHVPDLRRLGPVTVDLRGAAAADCPAREPVLRTHWAAARRRLAPSGATEALLCRYSGPVRPGAPPRLRRARRLTDPARVAGLLTALDRLSAPPPGPASCPSDDGSAVLIRLRYATRRLDLLADPGGCRYVANGALVRSAASSSLLEELIAFTG